MQESIGRAHLQLPRGGLREGRQRAANAADVAHVERLQAAHVRPGGRDGAHKIRAAWQGGRSADTVSTLLSLAL